MRNAGGMGGNNNNNSYQIQMVVSLTPAVKTLLIINGLVWVIGVVIFQGMVTQDSIIFDYFGLSPAVFTGKFFLWQPFTYMFLHSPQFMHIFFNSLMLWWIGSELEQVWGKKNFYKYYITCGVGAGLLYVAAMYLAIAVFKIDPGLLYVPTVGASGAVFGLMIAYGMLFGERVIYFMMLFPMKAKVFIMLLALMEVGSILSTGIGGPVNNLAHLGGLIVGFGYLSFAKYNKKRRQNKWMKGPGRRLKLVVDNDKEEEKSGPKKPTFH